MKRNLRLLLLVSSIFAMHVSFAQVTLISDNTNLTGGFVLPNGHPLLISSAGLIYTTNGTTVTLVTTSVTKADSASGGVYNGKAYFAGRAASDGDVELWATDGTGGGTALIKNISSTGSSIPENFFVFNNKLFFTADDGVHGRELWSSDGTSGNTNIVTDIDGASSSSFTGNAVFFINGSNAFFKATDASAKLGLYTLTSSGVSLVKNNFGADILLNSGIYCGAIGSKTVFTVTQGVPPTGTSELWVTDGTAANTTLLKNFGSGSYAMFPQLILFKNLLYFDGIDLTGSGAELWTTDGTAANTKLFKDLDPAVGKSSIPILLNSVILNDKLYFSATVTGSGTELWSTDGTPGNTGMVKDINPGGGGSNPSALLNVGAIQNLIVNGGIDNFNFQQLYTSFNGKIYFTANDGTNGTELWSSDGTSGGTDIVKDIASGSASGISPGQASFFTTTGIYFSATDGSTGKEPWVTDGTGSGTAIVADINSGSANSNPSYLFIYNKQLYLNAKNGGSDTDLYKIDQQVTALPVSLISFMGALQKGAVQLNWSTASEINTDRFAVERSIDGVHFSEIGTVTAKGSSVAINNYQFIDESALHAGSTTLYYRLRIVDKDGKNSYSTTLRIQLQNGEFSYSLSPNPAHSQLTVSFSGGNFTQGTIRITNATGKPVYEKIFQSTQGASVQQNINVSGLANGIYFVQLITGSETKTLKFIKQ